MNAGPSFVPGLASPGTYCNGDPIKGGDSTGNIGGAVTQVVTSSGNDDERDKETERDHGIIPLVSVPCMHACMQRPTDRPTYLPGGRELESLDCN